MPKGRMRNILAVPFQGLSLIENEPRLTPRRSHIYTPDGRAMVWPCPFDQTETVHD